ncbi:MAG TPA: hypothetical protein K8W01_05855 [Methylorubrum populi]|uniref:Uncharacterized protein n=1 Tax=Methylorubrum populi TaxID=223967 RepID=A0A921JDZ3_9HYPH|nr:hypothetical protein [Methylorubrum populi]
MSTLPNQASMQASKRDRMSAPVQLSPCMVAAALLHCDGSGEVQEPGGRMANGTAVTSSERLLDRQEAMRLAVARRIALGFRAFSPRRKTLKTLRQARPACLPQRGPEPGSWHV